MRTIALAAALLVAACGSSAPTSMPAAPTSASTMRPTPRASPTIGPIGTPAATTLDGVSAQVIPLGPDSTPIDVAFAFGSIWVAAHRYHEVIRIDPTTLTEIARIEVGSGPGWFAVTDDAVWVSLQLRRGLARIDPVTNTAEIQAGRWAPCWAPVVAFGSIWQAACDAHQLTRIDPVTYTATDFTVGDQLRLVHAGDRLILVGPEGISHVDHEASEIETIGGASGFPHGFAGGTVWISDSSQIMRVDPDTGAVVSTLPIASAGEGTVTEQGGYAWLVVQSTASVLKIDLATNEILRDIPIRPEPLVAREAAGALWVTSFDGNNLWRLEP